MGQQFVKGQALLGGIEARLEGGQMGSDGGRMQMAKIGQQGLRQPQGLGTGTFEQGEGAVQEAPEPSLPKPFRGGGGLRGRSLLGRPLWRMGDWPGT